MYIYYIRPIITKGPFHCKSISRWNKTALATSYWTQWRGVLCHILHTRRWHRTVNWHWEQPDPLQLDRAWEEQSVHQHCSAGCQLSWEFCQKYCHSTVQPHTIWLVIHAFTRDYACNVCRVSTDRKIVIYCYVWVCCSFSKQDIIRSSSLAFHHICSLQAIKLLYVLDEVA